MKTQVSVADGAGGLRPVQDHRFDESEWPITFQVPGDEADDWVQYMKAECSTRNWSSGGLSQIDTVENSGALSLFTAPGVDAPKIIVVWERSADEPMSVKARPVGVDIDVATGFFDTVHEAWKSRRTELFYRRGQLYYDGWAWKGELWLSSQLRLGPPTNQAPEVNAPRVVLVDAQYPAIYDFHANTEFEGILNELAVFLSVVLKDDFQQAPQGSAWTYETGVADCTLRNLGYWEPDCPEEMPPRGSVAPIRVETITRPALDREGPRIIEERYVPHDVIDLWEQFQVLPPDLRQQFLEVGNAWRLAMTLFPEHKTASLGFMVVACEAMKPPGKKYEKNGMNVYAVLGALLGEEHTDKLRNLKFRPQTVRSRHFHRAKQFGLELIPAQFSATFVDPSFDEAYSSMWWTTPAAIIEWLQLGCDLSTKLKPT